ncbi:MAG: hypothetical protein KGI50_06935 [Patescibacteria group bacterium]|nr:hypothetical protein [Patescibacteria group bacterium]MDE2439160.1 hypothetical protein [Patescibacteria group bacterium]
MRSSILATFSGKFGDILWALPAVKALSEKHGEQLDFGIMPEYRKLLPLLSQQPYIKSAYVIEEWAFQGSPYGDQPWCPPQQCEIGYSDIYHLTYRVHPMMQGLNLAQAISQNAGGVSISAPFIFLEQEWQWVKSRRNSMISVGFNPECYAEKLSFLEQLRSVFRHLSFVRVENETWTDAAQIIKKSTCFFGDMSSLHVLALGLGKECFIYEPNPDRRNSTTYRSPVGVEKFVDSISAAQTEIQNYVGTLGRMVQKVSSPQLSVAQL